MRHRLAADIALAAYVLALCSAGLGCPRPPASDTGPVSGFTDAEPPPPATTAPEPPPPVLDCPGETQCPCPREGCPTGQTCSPTGACTHRCESDRECLSGVSGESCLATAAGGGLCGVPCDLTTTTGGCPEAGMAGAHCVTVGPGDHVCGY